VSKLDTRISCASIALCLVSLPAWAHDPITTKLTWTQEISRIVDKKCVACHADFKAYATARPWAKAIRDEVTSRRMPPWGPVKGVGDFVGDPSLSGPEIDMLVAWVEGGAPEGDAQFLPNRIPAPEPAPALPRYSRSVAVEHELRLDRPSRIVAIRPKGLNDHAELEAWAVLPDGSVDHLIWLNDYHKVWTRNYVLRDPDLLPSGTRLRVEAKPAGALMFLLK
jgi:hypothetical protein